MCTLTNSILEALAAEGINAAETETVKNGVVCRGYQIDTGSNMSPVVYYSPDETAEAFVEKVIRIADQDAPKIDVDNLVSRERLLNNTVICVQKRGFEILVKKDFLNLEIYIRLTVEFPGRNDSGSIKVTPQILEQAGLTEEEVFEAARKNSLKMAKICTMAEALGAPEELFEEVPFFVGIYEDKCHGAAILAIPEVLTAFAEERGYENLYILPSSTEEILLLPAETTDPSELANIVNDVNTSTVEPMLQLEPCVYLFDAETQEVTIASSYREEV